MANERMYRVEFDTHAPITDDKVCWGCEGPNAVVGVMGITGPAAIACGEPHPACQQCVEAMAKRRQIAFVESEINGYLAVRFSALGDKAVVIAGVVGVALVGGGHLAGLSFRHAILIGGVLCAVVWVALGLLTREPAAIVARRRTLSKLREECAGSLPYTVTFAGKKGGKYVYQFTSRKYAQHVATLNAVSCEQSSRDVPQSAG